MIVLILKEKLIHGFFVKEETYGKRKRDEIEGEITDAGGPFSIIVESPQFHHSQEYKLIFDSKRPLGLELLPEKYIFCFILTKNDSFFFVKKVVKSQSPILTQRIPLFIHYLLFVRLSCKILTNFETSFEC